MLLAKGNSQVEAHRQGTRIKLSNEVEDPRTIRLS
jgi:hypothetical protein